MSSNYKEFQAALRAIDGADVERAVDMAMAQAADPSYTAPAWADTDDPFSANWAWAYPPVTPASAPLEPAPVSRRTVLRYAAYAGGGTIAAAAFIAVGGFIAGRRRPREVEVAVSANVTTRGVKAANGQVLSEFEIAN